MCGMEKKFSNQVRYEGYEISQGKHLMPLDVYIILGKIILMSEKLEDIFVLSFLNLGCPFMEKSYYSIKSHTNNISCRDNFLIVYFSHSKIDKLFYIIN